MMLRFRARNGVWQGAVVMILLLSFFMYVWNRNYSIIDVVLAVILVTALVVVLSIIVWTGVGHYLTAALLRPWWSRIGVMHMGALGFGLVVISIWLYNALHGDGSIMGLLHTVVVTLMILTVYGCALVSYYALGRAVMAKTRLECTSELCTIILSIGLGMAMSILFFYFAGALRLLTWWSVVAYLILCVGVGYRHCVILLRRMWTWRIGSSEPHALHTLQWLVAGMVAVLLVLVIMSLGGHHPVGADDMRSYYTVPKTFVDQGGTVSFPYDRMNNGPVLFAYLYTPFIIVSDVMVNYAGVFGFGLLLLAVYALGVTLWDKETALWGTILVASVPWNMWFLLNIKVDYLASFFTVLTILAVWNVLQHRRWLWLALGGVLLGTAVGIKYVTLLAIPSLLMSMTIATFAKRWTWQQVVMGWFIFAVSLGGVMAPWIAHNMLVWSNPTYPYTITGAYTWHTDLPDAVAAGLQAFYIPVVRSGSVMQSSLPWWQNLWFMLSGVSHYAANQIGPLFLGLMPFVAWAWLRQWRSTQWWYVGSIILVTVGLWLWVVASQVWYMMFVFPLWCLAMARATTYNQGTFARAGVAVVAVLVFIMSLSTNRLSMAKYYTGAYSQKEYQTVFGAGAELAENSNTSLLSAYPNYVLFHMGYMRQALFKDSYRHVYSDNTTLMTWVAITEQTRDPEAIRRALLQRGVTHVSYIDADINDFRSGWCGVDDSADDCAMFDERIGLFTSMVAKLSVVAQGSGWIVYRL